MTNEEIIQEILHEADEHGLMREVITEARKIMDENPDEASTWKGRVLI